MESGSPSVERSVVVCTQCGGENDLETGSRILGCNFCGSTLFVDRSAVVSHYRVPSLLSAGEAEAALRRWMAGNDTVKHLDRDATIESIEAISFPVWLFRTQDADGERVLFEPAAPTPIPQVADLKVPAGGLEPYRDEAEDVQVIDVQVPLATAHVWLEQRQAGAVIETALVRVPFWKCRYRYREQTYLAAVDASTGAVLAGHYPEKSESPYVLVAVLGVVLFGLEGLLIGNLLVKLVAYLFTAFPLTLLAYWVARQV